MSLSERIRVARIKRERKNFLKNKEKALRLEAAVNRAERSEAVESRISKARGKLRKKRPSRLQTAVKTAKSFGQGTSEVVGFFQDIGDKVGGQQSSKSKKRDKKKINPFGGLP